ncbi:MAG: HAMP domain-containing histidine kinase [Clostridia bacterium]|nr:HAMP domain-containing histidine kinase [Clostridia bacterium]
MCSFIVYEANKSMTENVKNYEYSINDFKEYVEMWIHEVKVPISSLLLMIHNHPGQFDTKAVNQIKRVDNYIEQVLYYVRSENAEKDYLITETNLNKIIGAVALKNKDDLLENDIDLTVSGTDINVLTDPKWLEFILHQIFNNSIKYKREDHAAITIAASTTDTETTVCIRDNGIGIPKADLPRVFEKSFTGHNGRIKTKSTGMGLYIAQKLCGKLGHRLTIDSMENQYTTVSITFARNDYYSVLK